MRAPSSLRRESRRKGSPGSLLESRGFELFPHRPARRLPGAGQNTIAGRRSTPKLANMETVAYVLVAVSLMLFCLFFASSRRESGSREILLDGKGTPWWRRRLRDPRTREETSLELLSALRADDWRSNELPLVVLLDEPLIGRGIDQVVPALVDLVESTRPGVSSPLKKCFEARFEAFSFRSSVPKRSQPAWFPSFGADDSGRGVPKGGRILGRMTSSTGC